MKRRPILTRLVAVVAAASGRPCAAYEAPLKPDSQEPADHPYTVIHPIDIDLDEEDLDALDEGGTLVFQIDSVGARGDQVDALADRVRAALLARHPSGEFVHPLDVDGWSESMRRSAGAGPPLPTGTGVARVWQVQERFEFSVAPDT